MHTTCCICFKQLPHHNRRDVFDEEPLIHSENNINEEPDKHIKLRDAIELIIGYKISKMDNAALCEACFRNVESYIKFRSQLMETFKTSCNRCNNQDLNTDLSENRKTSQITITFKEESKLPTKENIDMNIPSNSYHSPNNECNSDDFLSSPKLLNDQVNDNLNESDNSNDNSNINISQECLSKIQDIESEIDVCSGKDDEILESDVQYDKNVSTSSSESDVEVYDYGPTTKRMKHYAACSSAILL